MRIALVHSFYRSHMPSGENTAVLRQAEALQQAGHEVRLIARHTDDAITSRMYLLRTAIAVATGLGEDPTPELREFDPDVVHVHNLFPNFATHWLAAWEGAIVATVHNFRPLCANGLLFRDGRICTDCVSGSAVNAVRHACYRGSRIATLPLAVRNRGGATRDAVLRRADRVIVLSERSRTVYETAAPEVAPRLVVVPNAVEDRWRSSPSTRFGWVFVGRVSEEKGLGELLRVWPAGEQLTVLGDGPLADGLRRTSPPDVHWKGSVDQAVVDDVVRKSLGLVFPGVCIEGAIPLVAIESLMNATPVIALQSSGASQLVADSGCGQVYRNSQELARSFSAVRAAGEPLRDLARETYLSEFTVDRWMGRMESVYRDAGRT